MAHHLQHEREADAETAGSSRADLLGGRDVCIAFNGLHHVFRTAHAYRSHGRLGRLIASRFTTRPGMIRGVARALPGGAGRRLSKAAAYHDTALASAVECHADGPLTAAALRIGGAPRVHVDRRGFERFVAHRCVDEDWALHMNCGQALDAFGALSELAPDIPRVLGQLCGDRRTVGALLRSEADRLGVRNEGGAEALLGGFTDKMADWNEAEYELADRIVAGSRYVVRSLEAAGVAPEKIIYTPMGAKIEGFKPAWAARRQGEPLRVAFVGHLPFPKGLAYLAEAARMLGPSEVEVHAFGCARASITWDMPGIDLIRFRGSLPRHELATELARCHVGCLPSLSDGFGMAVMEMMACGLPAIVSENVGAPVRDGIEGFVTPIADPDPIAAALTQLADESRRSEMARAARAAAESAGWDRYAEALAEGLGFGSDDGAGLDGGRPSQH